MKRTEIFQHLLLLYFWIYYHVTWGISLHYCLLINLHLQSRFITGWVIFTMRMIKYANIWTPRRMFMYAECHLTCLVSILSTLGSILKSRLCIGTFGINPGQLYCSQEREKRLKIHHPICIQCLGANESWVQHLLKAKCIHSVTNNNSVHCRTIFYWRYGWEGEVHNNNPQRSRAEINVDVW